MTFEPPPTPSSAIVVAIDPPAGWCVWTSNGIVGADQHDDIHKAKQAVNRAVARAGRVHTSVIEAPYGGARKGNIREIVQNAMAAGWWMRHFYMRSLQQWVPTASEWRTQLGIPSDRALAKQHALKFADLICDIQGRPRLRGPKGGEREHASEAVCMCLSLWLKCGMVSRDDVAHRVIKALDIPYKGGSPLHQTALHDIAGSGYLTDTIRNRVKRPSNWHGMLKGGGDDDGDDED